MKLNKSLNENLIIYSGNLTYTNNIYLNVRCMIRGLHSGDYKDCLLHGSTLQKTAFFKFKMPLLRFKRNISTLSPTDKEDHELSSGNHADKIIYSPYNM
jgi:hypothetical protein